MALALVAAACAGKAPALVVPETILRDAGDGWRVIACAEGVEAQYWEDRTLLASSWRREPFTREQWTAFALGVVGDDLARERLRGMLGSAHPDVRFNAATGLARWGDGPPSRWAWRRRRATRHRRRPSQSSSR